MNPTYCFIFIPARRHLLDEDFPAEEPNADIGRTTSNSICAAIFIIVIVAVLLIVSIKFCRLSNSNSSDPDPPHPTEPEPQLWTDADLTTLPVIIYDAQRRPPLSSKMPVCPPSMDEESCAICLDDYVDGDRIRFLPKCEHKFHQDCIDQWLTSHSLLCPICRDQTRERNADSTG